MDLGGRNWTLSSIFVVLKPHSEAIADASLERPDHKNVQMRFIIISKDDYAELMQS
jgi:hypothetical protein